MRLSLLVGALVGAITTTAGVSSRGVQPTREKERGVFTVMTFNIQHGLNASGKYDLQRAIDVIAKVQPDLVGLQEVTRNHPHYRCDDQPAVIAAGLQQQTGHQWHQAYAQEWFTPDKSCMESGRGDGRETEGLAFLSPQPLEAEHIRLPKSRIAFMARTAAAGNVPVVVTHLANKKKGAPDRQKQLAKLLPWAERFGAPRLLIGDLNAEADSDELRPVLEVFRDAWKESSSARTAKGVTSGSTRLGGAGRIDYVLYVPGERITLESVETVDTEKLAGPAPSDHRPVVATFRVR